MQVNAQTTPRRKSPLRSAALMVLAIIGIAGGVSWLGYDGYFGPRFIIDNSYDEARAKRILSREPAVRAVLDLIAAAERGGETRMGELLYSRSGYPIAARISFDESEFTVIRSAVNNGLIGEVEPQWEAMWKAWTKREFTCKGFGVVFVAQGVRPFHKTASTPKAISRFTYANYTIFVDVTTETKPRVYPTNPTPADLGDFLDFNDVDSSGFIESPFGEKYANIYLFRNGKKIKIVLGRLYGTW